MIILNKSGIKKAREISIKLQEEDLDHHLFVQGLTKLGLENELFYAISKSFERIKNTHLLLFAMQEIGLLETRGDVKGFYEHSDFHKRKQKLMLYENVRRTSVEDLFSYLEWQLNRLAYCNIGYDNQEVPENVSSSMFGSLISTIPWICLAIRNVEPLKGRKKNISKRNSICKRVISSAGYFKTISTQISEVLRGDYNIVTSHSFYKKYGITENMKSIGFDKLDFFIELTNHTWRKNEIYRDLNYKHYINREETNDAIFEIAKKSGFVSSTDNGKLLKIDFAKGNDFQKEVSLKKSIVLLSVVYGGIDNQFTFNEKRFFIRDLVDIYKCIFNFCEKIQKENKRTVKSGGAKIFSGTKNKLLSTLKIPKNKSYLLELFSLKVERGLTFPSTWLPIIKIGTLYYIIPTYAKDHPIENLIDRILSREEISLDYSKGVGKGHLFEDYLKKKLEEGGYKVNRVKRSQKKNIPEIDGLFTLGGKYLILYEAKASIPPEEREDAYRFADNHISKALEQLDKRIEFIEKRPTEFEARTRYSAKELEIIPFIVSNAHYFSGAQFTSPNGHDVWFMDATTFLNILCNEEIKAWEPNGPNSDYTYQHSSVSLTSLESKISALKKPYQFLKSTHRGTIQILEHGVGFEIAYETQIF
ncbi:hypothetical protein [Aliikangiella coralliicola]|uniref:Uncharacterized protein n=1 Tax=Aliikangiella coralliicola TaxID=2592383 RepID=A0A545UDX1_9GAMM|nr:hypothetical protein [Aliikangiella coralliicola]TQV87672.1 hypothetical protein FLL46_09805 [Aliikangiella coralliicola]